MLLKSDSIGELAKALSQAQAEFPDIRKTKTANTGSYSYNYADLADILDAVRPTLSKHGLSVSQLLSGNGTLTLTTMLMHASGEYIGSEYEATVDEGRLKGQQAVGSALTYVRRYSLTGLLGVASEDDDDGRSAASPPPRRNNNKPAQPQETVDDPASMAAIKSDIKELLDRAAEEGLLTDKQVSEMMRIVEKQTTLGALVQKKVYVAKRIEELRVELIEKPRDVEKDAPDEAEADNQAADAADPEEDLF